MNIKELEDLIDEPEINGISDPSELLSNNDMNIITSILSITSKYKSGGLEQPSAEIMNDLSTLSANLVDLSTIFSTLSAYSDSLDNEISIAKSKIRNELKKIKDKPANRVKVTLDDIKDIINIKTENMWIQYQKHKQSAEYCKSLYYTTKEFLNILSNIMDK